MDKYPTVEELIKAKAEQTHEANLNYGGVFDENENRVSNLNFEIEWASKKVVHIASAYTEMTIGVELSHPAKYIQNFGYVELN